VYLEKPLRDFIKDTSSRTPTPGGGSVAAILRIDRRRHLSLSRIFTRSIIAQNHPTGKRS